MNTIELLKAIIIAFGPHDGVTLTRDSWVKLHSAFSEVVAELERVTTLARGQHVELYNARLELERLKSQEPVAHLYIDSYGKVKLGQLMPPEEGSFSVYLAAGAQPYSDSTAELSVGDSSFESWYASYVKEGTKGLKHHCRDAYAAGMGDPLVVAAGAQERKPLPHVPQPLKDKDRK